MIRALGRDGRVVLIVDERAAGAGVDPAPQAAALDPEARARQAKEERNRRWAKWAGTALAVVALLRVAAYFFPAGLPACDASSVRDALAGIAKENNLEVKDIVGIETAASESDHRTCTARLLQAEGGLGVTYRVYREDGKPMVRITESQPL